MKLRTTTNEKQSFKAVTSLNQQELLEDLDVLENLELGDGFNAFDDEFIIRN